MCIALISDWANPLARALLPVVVLGLAGCCIFLSWRHRKHAVVLTSKKLIVVQSLAKRVNINRVNLSDIQSIDVVKWTDSEYFGNVKVTKKDRTILVLNRVPSVVDFEAALGQNQFEGKLDPRESWKIGFWLFLGGFLLIEVQHIVLLLVQGHWVYYFSSKFKKHFSRTFVTNTPPASGRLFGGDCFGGLFVLGAWTSLLCCLEKIQLCSNDGTD